MNFNEKLTIETHFGKVEVVYIPKQEAKGDSWDVFTKPELDGKTESQTEVKESHYVATVLDGNFNGWNAKGVGRRAAVNELMKELAVRYADDLTKEF